MIICPVFTCSVGFCPNDRIATPNSLDEIDPFPSFQFKLIFKPTFPFWLTLSNNLNASLYSNISSSLIPSKAVSKIDWFFHRLKRLIFRLVIAAANELALDFRRSISCCCCCWIWMAVLLNAEFWRFSRLTLSEGDEWRPRLKLKNKGESLMDLSEKGIIPPLGWANAVLCLGSGGCAGTVQILRQQIGWFNPGHGGRPFSMAAGWWTAADGRWGGKTGVAGQFGRRGCSSLAIPSHSQHHHWSQKGGLKERRRGQWRTAKFTLAKRRIDAELQGKNVGKDECQC